MIKKYIHKLFRRFGYDISRIDVYKNPYEDIERLLNNKAEPVIFDIGANIGQSIDQFLHYFPQSTIYSFEPGPLTFLKLSAKFKNKRNIYLENIAIGSEIKKKKFLENEYPDMSSFLEIDRLGWGKINNEVFVDLKSIDNYCQANNITKIDLLKSDTQGFELEVLKGAMQMMKSYNIHLVYFEFIFSDMYKELPSFHEIYRLLSDNNFRLVSFYDVHYQEGMVSWADLLFVNLDFKDNS